MRRLVAAIRDNDERKVEEAVLQLARTRRILAPLALAAGALVMLFNGLRCSSRTGGSCWSRPCPPCGSGPRPST
jgi:hypothetical protein